MPTTEWMSTTSRSVADFTTWGMSMLSFCQAPGERRGIIALQEKEEKNGVVSAFWEVIVWYLCIFGCFWEKVKEVLFARQEKKAQPAATGSLRYFGRIQLQLG